MGKFLDSIIGKSAPAKQDDYMELDLAAYEGATGEEPASMYVRVAQVADIKESRCLSKNITASSDSYASLQCFTAG